MQLATLDSLLFVMHKWLVTYNLQVQKEASYGNVGIVSCIVLFLITIQHKLKH